MGSAGLFLEWRESTAYFLTKSGEYLVSWQPSNKKENLALGERGNSLSGAGSAETWGELTVEAREVVERTNND